MALPTLNAIFASGTVAPIITLSFSQENGLNLYYVLGYDEYVYNKKMYAPSAFQIALPQRNNSGFSDLNFAICDANCEIYTKLTQAIERKEPIYITVTQINPYTNYAEYELKLLLIGVTFSNNTATFTGSFVDTLNAEFPTMRFNDINAPGLKFVS